MKAKIKLYTPHSAQKILHQSPARFRIATCGRRWGKTLACANEIAKSAWEKPRSLNWWVAPVYSQSMIGYRMLKRGLMPAIARISDTNRLIELKNGSVIEFKSTDRPDSLKGEGLSFLVMDEAALIPRRAWEESLRPSLADKKGRAIFISTPKGRNWFFELFLRGQDPKYENYFSMQLPTLTNPYIDPEEIEDARLSLPSDVFRQEFEAAFIEDSAGVFRGIRECIEGELEEPKPGSVYLIGWDIARHMDFSVFVVIDVKRRHVVAFDRFNQVDWSVQLARLETLSEKYNNAKVIMDSTGVGDAILEAVEDRGIDVEGFRFTNQSKAQLIQNLSLMIERQELTYPEIDVLINELMIFQYEISGAGKFKYTAPEGYHDDSVIALALAAWGVKDYAPIQLFI